MFRVFRMKLWPGFSTHNLIVGVTRKLGRRWRGRVAPEVEVEAGARSGRGERSPVV